jgi:hypothetical protein
MKKIILLAFLSLFYVVINRVNAQSFNFSTGNPDGLLATASRPDSPGKIEIESADDFILTSTTRITSATFTGLLPLGVAPSSIGEVQVEIYRVFPKDSDIGRTSGPPTFTTPQVPTRVNSPSDVAFDTRNNGGGLTFTTVLLSANFTAINSIVNGINPQPNQLTGGEGPVSGQEVQFLINFTTPLDLPADHYFFVPQVELNTAGDFLWLSAPKPIVAPGTPFDPDLQAWIRNANLEPDWLREGTDIVGGTTFNGSFSLTGTVPDSGSTLLFFGCAAASLSYLKRRSNSLRL